MEGKVAVSRRTVIYILVVLLVIPWSLAIISDLTLTTVPSDGTILENLSQLTATGGGLTDVNYTVYYRPSGTMVFLNQTNETSFSAYTINLSDFSDGVYEFSMVFINATNSSDNLTLNWSNLIIDLLPPRVNSVSFSPNNPSSTSTSVTVTINVTDTGNITYVAITDGSTETELSFSSGSNYSSSAVFTGTFTPDTYGCVNDASCVLSFIVNDSFNYSNTTVQSDFNDSFFVDASAPSVLTEAINQSNSNITSNITLGAEWDEISLIDEDEYSVEFFKRVNGVWTSTINQLTEWDNSNLDRNWTNTTYWVNGSDEGQALIFKINLTDSQSRTTSTNNLVSVVSNYSPNIRVMDPPNGSQFASTTSIQLNITEIGLGVNLSTLNVTATFDDGRPQTTITRPANGSLFTCVQDFRDEITQVYLCNVSSSWLSGTFNLSINVSDLLENTNHTTFNGSIVQSPEIRNLTINNQNYTFDVSADSIAISITNSSRELNFSWNVSKNSPLNSTGIRFYNESPVWNFSTSTLPASVLLNVTAGKNYLIINATLEDSILEDEVQLNLTANVPINLSWIQAVHNSSSLISNWEVREDGVDIAVSTSDQYVNGTYDIVLTGVNQSNVVPYEFKFNHSSVPGLTVRWNATDDAWVVSQVAESELAQLNSISRANVTVALKNNGQNDIFFDGSRYLVSVEFNVSITNRSAYYRMKNSTGDSVYLLSACASTPTSSILASQSCYVVNGDNTTIYLPRFAQDDVVFFGQSPYLSPNVTINTPGLVSQSKIYVDFTAVTPAPNTSFCNYNISLFNRTLGNSSPYAYGELTTSNATFSGNTYSFNISAGPYAFDYEYNLTVSCEDIEGNVNTTRHNFTVDDTTIPKTISRSLTKSLGYAVVSVTADENTTLTVTYGLSEALGSSESDLATKYEGEVTLEDLTYDESYFYNVTLCDLSGNCNETGPFMFRALDVSSSSSGGGGSGGGGVSADGLESTDFRYWSALRDNQWMSYVPKNMAFTKIALFFSQAVEQAQMTLQQYATRPQGVTAAPTTVYKYFVATHSGLETVTDFKVSFRVPKEWYSEKNVLNTDTHILRFEDESWVGYTYDAVWEDDSYYYFNTTIPGFSFLAIGGKPGQVAVVEENTTLGEDETTFINSSANNTAGSNTDSQTGNSQSDVFEEEPKPFVSALDSKGFRVPFWVWIILIVMLMAGAVVGGLQIYKLQQKKEEEHKQQLQKEQTHYSIQKKAQQGDPLAQMQDYIIRMKGKNVPDEEIIRRLNAVGWDSVVVEQEISKLKD